LASFERIRDQINAMKNLESIYTKLRIYLRQQGTSLPSCELVESTVVEIVALRQNMHQRIVPMVDESFPEAFYTMEGICGVEIASRPDHQLYL